MEVEFGKAVWRSGKSWKTDPQVAHEALEKLRHKNGGELTSEDIVQAAKSKRHVLHDEFEWDDQVAAHQYRLRVAGIMVKSLQVVRVESPNVSSPVYLGVYKPQASKGERPKKAYQPMEVMLANPDTRADILARALRELLAVQARYRHLQELSVVFRAIGEVAESIEID